MEISFYRHSLLNRGGDRIVAEYANFLARKGYNVIIWYNVIETVLKLSPDIKLKKIPLPNRIGTITHAFLKKFHSDAIIVDIVSLASLISLRNRSRLVYFAQDYDVCYYKNPLKRLFIKILYHFCLNLMKIKTIAVSNNLADLLTKTYKTHVQAVENGIDLKSFYPEPDEVLLKSKGDNKAILLLSRKDYRKGLDIAIRVINITSPDLLQKIEIWTCGEKLENGISNTKVRNFGWVGIDDLRKILSSADVLFYPTRHEGFGLLPLEAMACGCPVITTQAVPYVIDSENALVTEVEDIEKLKIKLREILSNKSLCDRLKQNGLITAKNYDIKESQMKFSKTLNQLLSS